MNVIVPETAEELRRILEIHCGFLQNNLGWRHRQVLYRAVYNQMFIAVTEIEEASK
jgi:hypothetical protein